MPNGATSKGGGRADWECLPPEASAHQSKVGNFTSFIASVTDVPCFFDVCAPQGGWRGVGVCPCGVSISNLMSIGSKNKVNRFSSPDLSHFLRYKSTSRPHKSLGSSGRPVPLLISRPGDQFITFEDKERRHRGDSLYPFDLWSQRRGRAFLGHANPSQHKCQPLPPPLCVELISLAERGSEGSVRCSECKWGGLGLFK